MYDQYGSSDDDDDDDALSSDGDEDNSKNDADADLEHEGKAEYREGQWLLLSYMIVFCGESFALELPHANYFATGFPLF